jgi:hypothetical protein
LIEVKVPGSMKNPASINQDAAAAATLYLRPTSFDSRTMREYDCAIIKSFSFLDFDVVLDFW